MIELINVSKYYPTEFGRHYVFSNVSLVLPLDKNVAVIGPNGSGKSTFLRLLGGADVPSEGRIRKTGRISPPMGLTPGLQAPMTGSENTRFACRIYGMTREQTSEIIDKVRDMSGIGRFFDIPVAAYSAGMRQRVAFAINMSMNFDYYLFDEISAGGDRSFRKMAKAMVNQRLSTSNFIIASHRTDELIDLCQAAILIKDGELTYYPRVEDALAMYRLDDEPESEPGTRGKRRRARKPQVDSSAMPAADPPAPPGSQPQPASRLEERMRALLDKSRKPAIADSPLALVPVASPSVSPPAPRLDLVQNVERLRTLLDRRRAPADAGIATAAWAPEPPSAQDSDATTGDERRKGRGNRRGAMRRRRHAGAEATGDARPQQAAPPRAVTPHGTPSLAKAADNQLRAAIKSERARRLLLRLLEHGPSFAGAGRYDQVIGAASGAQQQAAEAAAAARRFIEADSDETAAIVPLRRTAADAAAGLQARRRRRLQRRES